MCVYEINYVQLQNTTRDTVPVAVAEAAPTSTSVFSPAPEENLSEGEGEYVVNCDTIQVGMVVACFVQCYGDEEPQIGKVVALEKETESVVIEWMTGTYSEPWVLYRYRKEGMYTTWRETIPISSVLYPI